MLKHKQFEGTWQCIQCARDALLSSSRCKVADCTRHSRGAGCSRHTRAGKGAGSNRRMAALIGRQRHASWFNYQLTQAAQITSVRT
jgi:hypothetical protein